MKYYALFAIGAFFVQTVSAEKSYTWSCCNDVYRPVLRLDTGEQAVYAFQENLEFERGATATIQIEGDGPIESVTTPYQKIDVYQTRPFGKMLVLDDIIQLTQYDNFAYHEMIAHVPLCAHPNPKRVLIVGGGDGGTVQQVLKHASVSEVVVCEIDVQVIAMSKKYFPELATSFDDPRVTILAQDATTYIQQKRTYFDVICVDSSDPIGPAQALFEKAFYQDLYACLTDDGIAVSQGESLFYHHDEIIAWCQRNKHIFPYASYYYTLVPTYPSGTIGFLFCSKKYGPTQVVDEQRIAALPALHYYTSSVHAASFVVPQFLAQHI